jgi:hypothetical protein
MDTILGPGAAEAAAGEIALMLLLTDGPSHYGDLNTAVAEALAGEGWHGQRDGNPLTADQAAGQLGDLRLLGLTTQERLGAPTRLSPTGHAATHIALRPRPPRAPTPARLTRALRGTAASAEPVPIEALQQARRGVSRANTAASAGRIRGGTGPADLEVPSYRIGTAWRIDAVRAEAVLSVFVRRLGRFGAPACSPMRGEGDGGTTCS